MKERQYDCRQETKVEYNPFQKMLIVLVDLYHRGTDFQAEALAQDLDPLEQKSSRSERMHIEKALADTTLDIKKQYRD